MAGAGYDVKLNQIFLPRRNQGVAEVIAALHVDISVRFTDGQEQSST